jgi:pyrroloquinoline quinone (PQQ) biosynthesis protein C
MTIFFARFDNAIHRHAAWNNPIFEAFRSAEKPWPGWKFIQVIGPDYLFVTKRFPSILSLLIARVTDEKLRSLLVGILHSELGSGDFRTAHYRLFENLLHIAGLSNYSTENVRASTKGLVDGLRKIYRDRPLLVALGAQYTLEAQAENMLTQLHEGFRDIEKNSGPLDFFKVHQVEEINHIAAMRPALRRRRRIRMKIH